MSPTGKLVLPFLNVPLKRVVGESVPSEISPPCENSSEVEQSFSPLTSSENATLALPRKVGLGAFSCLSLEDL